MRIGLLQMNPTVGDFDHNLKAIEEGYEYALSQKIDLLITPELSICGYPPHDLIMRPEMLTRNDQAIEKLKTLTSGKPCALAIGHITRGSAGKRFLNQVSVIAEGKTQFTQSKRLLPTYDVFDEDRYFERGDAPVAWEYQGVKVGFAICEDLWVKDQALSAYQGLGLDLLISLSASPYEWDKREERESLHGELSGELKCPVIYVNQTGANDEILFDGGSFAWNPKEGLCGRLPLFHESKGMVEWQEKKVFWLSPEVNKREDQAPEEIETLSRALVSGVRDYFKKTGFQKAIIGLSGGIDSALVATIAARALGAENVIGIMMPSQYSSSHSLADAEALASGLGIRSEIRPIKFLFSTMKREWSEGRGELKPIALENLQARIRGTLLMTLANHENALVLTTGNKSELATGYCTLYGDMVGAIDPIGDLLKSRVYELARWINQNWGELIPESTISKAPSAELKPDQKDIDSLPDYEKLDPVLEGYLEQLESMEELEAKYPEEKGWIRDILIKIEQNEYKRRQSAMVFKVSTRAFGVGRRIPVAKKWARVDEL